MHDSDLICKNAVFPDLVTELLGSDLMEHNILHNGIGIEEALEILNRKVTWRYVLY